MKPSKISRNDLIKLTLEKCSDMNYGDVTRVCEALLSNIEEEFLKANIVNFGLGDFRLKLRGSNKVFSEKSGETIVIRGDVDWQVKESLVEQSQKDPEFRSKLGK